MQYWSPLKRPSQIRQKGSCWLKSTPAVGCLPTTPLQVNKLRARSNSACLSAETCQTSIVASSGAKPKVRAALGSIGTLLLAVPHAVGSHTITRACPCYTQVIYGNIQACRLLVHVIEGVLVPDLSLIEGRQKTSPRIA
jgi:hypothetical protein